jgi:hypothetical protein
MIDTTKNLSRIAENLPSPVRRRTGRSKQPKGTKFMLPNGKIMIAMPTIHIDTRAQTNTQLDPSIKEKKVISRNSSANEDLTLGGVSLRTKTNSLNTTVIP